MKITDKTTVKELKENAKERYYLYGKYDNTIKIIKAETARIFFDIESKTYEAYGYSEPAYTGAEILEMVKKDLELT